MNEESGPWYEHFWPWFIVFLLGISVAGSLVTVAIAYRYGDVEVARISPSSPPAGRGIPEPPRRGSPIEAAGPAR